MTLLKRHPQDKLSQYADGELSPEESQAIEEHLATCADCREEVTFIRQFDAGLAALPPNAFVAPGPCPDSETLVAYEAGEVDEETARRLRVHVFRCDRCVEKFYALRRARPKTIDLALRFARGMIECVPSPEGWILEHVPLEVDTHDTKRSFRAKFRITETLVDLDGNSSAVTLRVEEAVKAERVRVVLECRPASEKWRASVCSGDGEELADGITLRRPQVEIANNLTWGSYTVEVSKEKDLLGRFNFTIEPFHLPEALEAAVEHVEAREYDHALAILEDAVQRYPDSRDAWDLFCLALALIESDEEARLQPQWVRRRSHTDIEKEIKEVLHETRTRFGEDLASALATAAINPASLTKELLARVAVETVSVTVLPIMKMFAERTDLLSESAGTMKEMLSEVFVEFGSRLEKTEANMAALLDGIEAVRHDVQRDVDEKFAAITVLLDEKIHEIEQRQARLSDYSPVLRETLGEPCWEWLDEDVQRIFTTAEGVYHYWARQPAKDSPDLSPSLLQYCRGFELLLNMKVGRWCSEIRDSIEASEKVQHRVTKRFTWSVLSNVLRRHKTFSIVQVANLLRIARARHAVSLSPFSRQLETLLAASPSLIDCSFLEVLGQVGSFFRNGKVHPVEGDPSMFTSVSEMQLLRKLLVGLDENRAAGDSVFKWAGTSPRLSQSERQRVTDQLKAAWPKYPGLVSKLWTALVAV